MSQLLLVTILFLSASCNSKNIVTQVPQDSNAIIYVLPLPVNNLLEKFARTNDGKVYFCLDKKSDYFELHGIKIDKKILDVYAERTNRRIFLNGSFYPLMFEMDITFGTGDNVIELTEKYKKEKYPLISKPLTIHEGYFIKFKSNGEVVEEGYFISKPNN